MTDNIDKYYERGVSPADNAGDLIEQLQILIDHKWTIVGIVLAAMIVAGVVVFSLTPSYRATASIMIEPRESKILDVQDIYTAGAESSGYTYYTTQYEILHSRDLARKAVKRIDWSKYPDFAPEASPAGDKPPAGDDPPRDLVSAFMRATQIQPVSATLLVHINFISSNPQLAREAANALTDVYIESGFEAKLETARRTTDWMSKRLETLRQQLKESEAKLQDFREEHNLVNVGGGKPVLAQELADNMKQLRETQQDKTELENTYNKIQKANGQLQRLQEIAVIRNQDAVQDAQKDYVQAQGALNDLQSRYGPKHPKVVAAQSRLQEARANYLEQLRSAAESIRSQYEIAANNVTSLEETVDKTRDQIRNLDRRATQLDVLQRNVDTNRELYDAVLTRFKKADIEGQFESLRAHVVDPAILPDKPFKPSKKRWIGLAGGGALVFAICLVWLRERLDDGIHSSEEFEDLTGVSVLASAPIAQHADRGTSVSRLLLDEPQSLFTEGIRTVRTSIVLSDLDKKNKRLLVTSALPQEGKTCIASNLALAFGQMEKVLLIDADLRRPSLGRYLGLAPDAPGMTELLSGAAYREQVVHRIAGGIDFIPVGKLPPNPAELLSTDRFQEAMASLMADYDRVIIDSSPCQPVSDTMLLARHADAVIFVTEAEATSRKAVQHALKRLDLTRVRILGAVLNRYDHTNTNSYGENYYYGYNT